MTQYQTVKYSRTVHARKQHSVKQSGIEFSSNGDTIDIFCINEKTNSITTYLRMQIPREDLGKVVEALKLMI